MFKNLLVLLSLSFSFFVFAAESVNERKLPMGFIVVEEQVVTDMRVLPFELLQKSKNDFLNNNFGEASADISAAARILKSEAIRADNAKRGKSLSDVSVRLERVARDVKDRKIKSERELSSELSRAAYQTAAHHRILALEEWSKKEYNQAGHDLKAAAVASEHALQWSGKEIEIASKEAVSGARFVAGKLIQGAGWTTAEVGSAFEKLGKATEKLGNKVL